jgi:class 3 adenylate cyclase
MALADDLTKEVETIFKSRWEEREGREVPDPAKLKLSNDGLNLEATILYADMAGSTKLVNDKPPQFAAEVYKAFLTCSARLVRAHGGTITAYDGDRIMGVYIGDSKNTSAVKTALRINYAMEKIIKPALKATYPNSTYEPGHSVGIDTSKILVARIGVRNDNDLVWVGRAANYAAKLCSLRDGDYVSWITGDVYDAMHKDAKISVSGRDMWEERVWKSQGDLRIYRSNWHWKPNQ